MSQFLMVLVITIVLFTINASLALLVLAVTPVMFAAALGFRRIARWSTQRGQRATAEVNAAIQETVSGIAVAKSFRQEAAIYDDFRNTNQLAFRVRLIRGLVINTIFPTLDLISGIATALVIFYGGQRALAGTLSTGEWYLFVQTLGIFLFPLTSIASFWSQFQQGLSASERVFALIDADPKVVQTARQPVGDLQGRITFEHVRFRYSEPDERRRTEDETPVPISDNLPSKDSQLSSPVLGPASGWVLPDFSLDIPAGQMLAIVGHTGSRLCSRPTGLS